MIRADREMIRRVVTSLTGNALKFALKGGRRNLSACACRNGRTGAQTMEIAVKDTETGMSPEGISGLFVPFGQLEPSLTKKYEGAGPGLCLSGKLVELHGGDLMVESEPGGGCRFAFTTPLERR